MLFPTLNLLCFYISALWSTCTVPNLVVFCSSLISCCPLYVAHVFSEWFWGAPIVTAITFVLTFHLRCIYIVWSLYFKIISTSFFYHISISITDYDVWFVVGNGSVRLHLMIPQYDYLAFLTCLYKFWYMLIPVFTVKFYRVSLYIAKSSEHTLYHVIFVLFFCQN
jgi:hypothetical protein